MPAGFPVSAAARRADFPGWALGWRAQARRAADTLLGSWWWGGPRLLLGTDICRRGAVAPSSGGGAGAGVGFSVIVAAPIHVEFFTGRMDQCKDFISYFYTTN